MKNAFKLCLPVIIALTIISCSKSNDNSKPPGATASILAKWKMSVDSIVVYDNGKEVQKEENEYAANGFDFLNIQFNADGTGMQTMFNGSMTDTPIKYTLSGNSITINFAESDLGDPAYSMSGTVQTLTVNKLVLDLQQTTVKGSVTEKTTHDINYSK